MAQVDMPDVTARIMRGRVKLLGWIIGCRDYPANNTLSQDYSTQADLGWLYAQGLLDAWGPDWKTCLFVPTDKGRAWLVTARERLGDE